MPKLTFITTNHFAPKGGSEVLWSGAAEQLLQEKIAVSFCAREWPEEPEHLGRLRHLGGTAFLIPPPAQNRKQQVRDFLKSFAGASPLARFGGWLDAGRPDLVVFSMGNSVEGFELIEECQRRGHPYALLVQLVSEHNWLNDIQTARMCEIYQNARCCFFVSEGNRRLVEKMTGIRLLNTKVVQNPCSVSCTNPFEWVEKDDVLKVACVASLNCLHKGQDVLFEVLRQEKWKNRPIEFSLVGEGLHSEILARLKKIWAISNVNFSGYCPDISAVWKTHHALVMPSRMEGMPLALIEAMMSGRVCIVSDVGGNAELIQDGINGFIFPSPTRELLDEGLERAWERRAEWREIGRLAFDRAHQALSRDPIGDFSRVLLELAGKAAAK